MTKQKTMTFEKFQTVRRSGPHPAFAELLANLCESDPVVVTAGNEDVSKRRTAFLSAARTRFGNGRVATRIVDGVLWACLMPESENSK